jgi:hypothetical protein
MSIFRVVAPCSLVDQAKVYQTTWRYNPEDSHLRTHRRENLKSNNMHVRYPFSLYNYVTKTKTLKVDSCASRFLLICFDNRTTQNK